MGEQSCGTPKGARIKGILKENLMLAILIDN